MIGQDKITQVITNLKVLSSITPGKTLSTSTMTLVDHASWSGAIWRTYSGENREETIATIKRILQEALSILKLLPDSMSRNDLLISLNTALMGVLSLKDTYKGNYYTVGEINDIVDIMRLELSRIYSSTRQENNSHESVQINFPVDPPKREHVNEFINNYRAAPCEIINDYSSNQEEIIQIHFDNGDEESDETLAIDIQERREDINNRRKDMKRRLIDLQARLNDIEMRRNDKKRNDETHYNL